MTQPDNPLPFEQVARRLHPDSHLLRAWPLEGGGSALMTALEILLPDGQTRKRVVRRFQGGDPAKAGREFRLLRLVHSAGIPVPIPYDLDESGTIFATPYLVIDYVDGRIDFAPANIGDFARQMAAQLAAIHQLDTTTLDLSFLPRHGRGFGDVTPSEAACPDAAPIRAALETRWPLPQVNPPALLHGDFWPGNVLWRDGQVAAVIDWEDAAVGDPLADFAITRLDMRLIFGLDAMQAFTEAYQTRMTLDFTHLAYWDLCAALRAAPYLADWAVGYPALGRPDITAETLRAGHAWFTAHAFARLSPR